MQITNDLKIVDIKANATDSFHFRASCTFEADDVPGYVIKLLNLHGVASHYFAYSPRYEFWFQVSPLDILVLEECELNHHLFTVYRLPSNITGGIPFANSRNPGDTTRERRSKDVKAAYVAILENDLYYQEQSR